MLALAGDAATPYRVSADCKDCQTATYVTAKVAIAGANREPLCQRHAEQLDANRMLAVGSARRVGLRA